MNSGFWSGKRVFLTGHTGFKGSWLALWLTQMGAVVKGYALAPDTEPALYQKLDLDHKMTSVIADLADAERLKKEMRDWNPDVVFHLAAQPLVRASYEDPVDTYKTNVMGTIHFLEALRACPKVRSCVIVTTDKVYENFEVPRPYEEHDPLGGYDPYSSSKACTEIVTSSWRRSFFAGATTKIATARAGNVIGGGDWATDRLIPDFVRAMTAKTSVQIRNPHSVRPWQHVLEPLAGYLTLAERLFEGGKGLDEAFNFGPREVDCRSVGEIADLAQKKWAGRLKIDQDKTAQPHEAGLLKLNAQKSQRILGWQPQWNLDETVSRTLQWYEDFRAGKPALELCQKDIAAYTAGHAK